MLGRYSIAVCAGAVVTALLIYVMQGMIGTEGADLPPSKPPLRLVSLPPVVPPPSPPPIRTPPEPPPPHPGPPDVAVPIPYPTTDPTLPDGPATPPGPKVPPAWSGGRTGPWAADSDVVLVARVRPPYPHDAATKGIEGHVVVEFTVTHRGEVEDIRVVESSHGGFERAAAAAVARARYRPRIVGGMAVDTPGQRLRIAFRLED
jgi:protein TonB